MRSRDIFWLVVLVLLGFFYVHFFVAGRHVKVIQIEPSFRPTMGRSANSSVYPVFFTLDDEYSLTSVKVTTQDTNDAKSVPHVVWELVSTEGSSPIKFFSYGQYIGGMSLGPSGAGAEPLQADVVYHLELKAGKIKGARDFVTREIH